MFQQKFTPYNQMNEVYEEQQYEQEDSQPLIQEVDPDYQPTQKQVKQYAISVLGMNLPEDERLLYLAREGLKAPIPENWQPYQGRDGQVYYKHKITQQKTYEHPTDVEYRKRYTQEKQRAARKNLKSMNLKNNPLGGLSQPFGQPSLGGLGSKIGINPLGLSNISSQDHQTISKQVSKLDPKFEQKLQQEVQELQQRLSRQFQQFQQQRKLVHDKNMKKYKLDFENNLSQLKKDKSNGSSYEKLLKQEKQRIKQRLKQAYDDRFKDEFNQVQKQQEKKYNQFVQLYEQDNKIKIKKYQTQKQRDFTERVKRLQNLQKKHQQFKRQKQKQRQNILIKMRQKYQLQDNQQIQQATKQTYMKQLNKIKDANKDKIRQFQQKLQVEYQQMRKILGHDPNKILQQMAEKKSRLKKISQQKLESLKKKQFQKISQSFSQNLQKCLKQAQASLEVQNAKQILAHKSQTQKKLALLKTNFENEMKEKIQKKIEQIYAQAKKSTTQYQKQKNKKILEMRQKFISQIISKNDTQNQELDIKLGMKEKQEMIENKQELIKSLARQIQLQSVILKQLRMNKTIATSTNMDAQLKKLVAELKIIYKPQQFLKHQKRYNQLKQKYKADKQLLGSMMTQLQNSAFMPFYNKKNYDQPTNRTSTTAILTKQYNMDVRIMRKNEQMLNKYEVTLRRAQLNDQKAIEELENQNFQYEDISLRVNQRGQINDPKEPQLKQIQNSISSPFQQNKFYPQSTNNGYQSIEDKLQQHSKFLSNVKAQLNRKLYKVRNNNYFRV